MKKTLIPVGVIVIIYLVNNYPNFIKQLVLSTYLFENERKVKEYEKI